MYGSIGLVFVAKLCLKIYSLQSYPLIQPAVEAWVVNIEFILVVFQALYSSTTATAAAIFSDSFYWSYAYYVSDMPLSIPPLNHVSVTGFYKLLFSRLFHDVFNDISLKAFSKLLCFLSRGPFSSVVSEGAGSGGQATVVPYFSHGLTIIA